MDTLNILIAIIGTLATLSALVIALLAWLELGKVKAMRDDIAGQLATLKREHYASQKAQQLIMASYGVADAQTKLQLLCAAVETAPASFNAYNALGYAHQQAGDNAAALEAFSRATALHPDDKAGWCDLARLHVDMGRDDLAKAAIERAAKTDKTVLDDIRADSKLSRFA